MATNTFERKIEITNPSAVRKLAAVMETESPMRPLSKRPYGVTDREKSDALLTKWLSRSSS